MRSRDLSVASSGHPIWKALLLTVLVSVGCLTDAGGKRGMAILGQLEDPAALESLRAELSAEPDQVIPVLLQTARAVGAANALQAAAFKRRCQIAMFKGAESDLRYGRMRMPGVIAAEELVELLAEDGALADRFLAAGDPLKRSLAVLARMDRAADFFASVEATRGDRAPLVVEALNNAFRCVLVKDSRGMLADRDKLKRYAEDLTQRQADDEFPGSCKGPGAVAERLTAGLLDGSLGLGGPSSSNRVFHISLKRRAGGQVDLNAACALDVYQATAEKGTYLPKLIAPILRFGVPAPAQRRKAAALLLRDLDRYPDEERNLYLARAVNGGAETGRRVSLPRDTFAKEDLLEAAGRQGTARAREALARHVLCRGTFGGGERVALLGFVPGQESADLAYRIGKQCEHGVGQAAVALIRLEDPRAVEVLRRALAQPFIPESLYQALEEHPQPALTELLETCQGRCREHADRLLDFLKPPPAAPLSPQKPAG